jgi:aspartate kinase
MIGRPGVAATMFSTLAEAGINIQLISTSEVKVSCTVDMQTAIAPLPCCARPSMLPLPLLCLWPEEATHMPCIVKPRCGEPPSILKQARVAIRHVPDRPGMAAKIFQLLASKVSAWI